MADRLEAHHENRIYYFTVTDKKPGELSISMYQTPYTFLEKDGVWVNSLGNKMNMVTPLIAAVVAAAV
ncbi:hypothetical protein [Mucilaginibacter myungsuensis]|uniref:Uncharacterized protein n=1 Tax=Mucilaginibacter myungsuensis TaxID=649104 RepID=A0A929PWU9_9SPHI|nr:hypothetical protein [Mucilaginibacter myungsuensis]MBE9663213.1 hypothetical protein [Mucilaginibacter myungsuensis]MDN3598846.1 hypothetical protein [Mucilaginibacter myungsuensis]